MAKKGFLERVIVALDQLSDQNSHLPFGYKGCPFGSISRRQEEEEQIDPQNHPPRQKLKNENQ